MITSCEIAKYITGEKALISLTELLNVPGTNTFFEIEYEVLQSLLPCRQSAERIMDYLMEIDSITAWESLIKEQWDFLSDEEKDEWMQKAYRTIEPSLLDDWFSQE